MTKLETYKLLLEKFKNVDTYNNISIDINLRGSLAYFVEKYYDEPGWENLKSEIIKLAERNQVNELCWKLYNLIYKKYEIDCKQNPKLGKIHIIKNFRAMYQELYKEGKCNDFSIVRVDALPDFFIKHEYITGK